jgi:hypothetical protein
MSNGPGTGLRVPSLTVGIMEAQILWDDLVLQLTPNNTQLLILVSVTVFGGYRSYEVNHILDCYK